MEEGKFDPQLAWLAPANKPNPFQLVQSVSFKDSGPEREGQRRREFRFERRECADVLEQLLRPMSNRKRMRAGK